MNDKKKTTKKKIPRLTKEQWNALARFQCELSERLDVGWKLSLFCDDEPRPMITVTLIMPKERHFQSLDEYVREAFAKAPIPDYEEAGFGFTPPNPGAVVLHRDIDFCASPQ